MIDPVKAFIATVRTIWPGSPIRPRQDIPSPDESVQVLAEAVSISALAAGSAGALDVPIASITVTVTE